MNDRQCVLAFSGGRDSTISTLRLSKYFGKLILVTVVSDKLSGLNAVRKRITELNKLHRVSFRWFAVKEPKNQFESELLLSTCLPCQCNYIAIASVFALNENVNNIALGYSGYQNSWEEQTPKAVSMLRTFLESQGLVLYLPVYDVTSKEAIKAELRLANLSDFALEQKCSKYINNKKLEPKELDAQLRFWIKSIKKTIERNCFDKLKILDQVDNILERRDL